MSHGSASEADDYLVRAEDSTVARTLKHRFGAVAHVFDFGGCKWSNSDNGDDCTEMFQAAIASGKPVWVPCPPSGYFYRFNSTLTLTTGQALLGLGAVQHCAIRAYHSGPVFEVYGTQVRLANLDIGWATAYEYAGVGVKWSGGSARGACYDLSLDNVRIYRPRVGLWGSGDVYVSSTRDLNILSAQENAVLFDNTEGGAAPPQGIHLHFKEMSCNDAAGARETAVIKSAGSTNVFMGGELLNAKYQLHVGSGSYNNRVIGQFGEATQYSLKAEAGATVYWDAHSAIEPMVLDADARVYGPSGQPLGRANNFFQRSLRLQKDLKALWWFSEGSGSTVYDHSGNERHLTTRSGTLWEENGRWGKGLLHDPANSRGVDAIPLATATWTSPFTFAALIRREANLSTPAILTFVDAGGRYLRLERSTANSTVTSYDGSTVVGSTLVSMQDSTDDGWGWVIAYFDPVNQTVRLLDPVRGPSAFSPAPAFRPWVVGGGAGVSAVYLMHNSFSTQGVKGVMSFCALWQRELKFDEVMDLVNMRHPALAPRGGADVARLALAGGFQAPSGTSLTLRGSVPDTAGQVAVKIVNTTDLASNARVVAIYRGDGTTSLLEIDRFGSVINSGSGGSYFANFNAAAATSCNVRGQFANGAAAYGVKVGNTIDLSNATAKPFAVFRDNISTEVFSVRSDGALRLASTTGPLILTGTATPEGAVTAGVGSLFLRSDGGASTTLYVKESGAGNTGWVAK